jgi:serine/threonine protein kinase
MIGQTISHYRIVEKLGGGGMGVVYKAEDTRLHRFVALKFLPDDVANDPQALERFRREAQAASALNHPNICTIYDIGEDRSSDGRSGEGQARHYIVMEYLEGTTLKYRIEGKPISVEQLVDFASQIADALYVAHTAGIVHRDIKPANLFAAVMGLELDFLKVLDFGLVRQVATDPVLTAEQGVWGTPAYIAPESASFSRYDARSDIYSLGAVAYWLLTGKTVFEAPSGNAMIAAQIRDTPVPPSLRTDLPIPPDLEAVILACLAKDPDARPQSGEQLSRMLAAVPVPAWTQRRAEAWWRVHHPEALSKASTTQITARHRRTHVVAEAA